MSSHFRCFCGPVHRCRGSCFRRLPFVGRPALFVCAGGLFALGEGMALGHGEINVARDSSGRLVGFLEDEHPIAIGPSALPGFEGFATGLVGFHSFELNEPGEDRFALSPSSEIQAVLVGVDEGIVVHNGVVVMAPGDAMSFGNPPFDYHPVYEIPEGVAGGVYRVRYVFHDVSGVYADSEELEVTFVAQRCPADFNLDGAVNSQDFFDLLEEFFAGSAEADFNEDEVVNSQDFFDFLGEFFSGCA